MGWILENLFLIIIVVSGIISFFSNLNNQGNEKRKQGPKQNNEQPRQRTNPAAQPRQTPAQRPTKQQKSAERDEGGVAAAKTIAEQQKEQIERLGGKLENVSKDLTKDIANKGIAINSTEMKNNEDFGVKEKAMRGRLKSNLNGDGLINGIIMSEVLGKPRAKQPNQSRYKRRI